MVIKTLPNDDQSRLARIGASGPDVPITLKDACRDVFKDRITVATLMAEHRRGKLVIYRIGRQHFTTVNKLNAMLANCRVQPLPGQAPVESLNNQSDEARTRSAHAAARLVAESLKAAGRRKNRR